MPSRIHWCCFAAILSFLSCPAWAQGQPREVLRLDEGWAFLRGDAAGADAPSLDDSAWQRVALPHDWSIAGPVSRTETVAGNGGYFPTGLGWYRLKFAAPPAWTGRRVEIEFDGSYMNTEVWLNGVSLGRWVYGYTPFRFDLTPHLKPGSDNLLSVRVDNSAQPNTRWYSGSGLYRPVWLRVTDPVHVPDGGVFVVTDELTGNQAKLTARTEVRNSSETAHQLVVRTEILDPQGRAVVSSSQSLSISANGAWTSAVELVVPKPQPWSPDSPVLYQAITRVLDGERVLDEVVTRFGIRTARFSAARGFELNGRSLKFLGGNAHHDTGPLGAAAFARAEERKVELLKAAGFNAVRTAHNPPSTAFLDACDRLGLLVMDEIFDGWEKKKNKQDYGTHFKEWWARDVEAWVRRDRHHASVVIWSAGNEMFERGSASGQRIAGEIADRIREFDTTRPVSAGVNGLSKPEDWPKLDPLFAAFDIAGYNYELARHTDDHARLPERVIMASESYQTETFANWVAMSDHPYVVGDFVWTALDYLGEAGIGRVFPPGEEAKKHWEAEMFPWHGAYCGDIDLTGWRKPVSHYRNIVWDRGEKLYAAVFAPAPGGGNWNVTPWSMPPSLPVWTWPGHEGQPLKVEVYSRHEAVRLELNGHSLGEKPTTRAEEFKAVFTVPYAAGELKAVGLRGGQPVETLVLKTAGKTARLRLRADREKLTAGGQDLAFVTVEALDANGIWQPHADPRVTFNVEGAGSLAAVGSGDMTSLDSYQGSGRTLFQGRALAVVRSTAQTGSITLTATSPGLEPDRLTLESIKPEEK
jgi:beta-galactosidase